MAVDMAQFILQLLIAGMAIRFVQMKLSPDSDIRKALVFIY